jgi:hypothetical protein
MSSMFLRKNMQVYFRTGRDYSDLKEFMHSLKNAFNNDKSTHTTQTISFMEVLSEKVSCLQNNELLNLNEVPNITNLNDLRLISILSAFFTDSPEYHNGRYEYLNKIESLKEEVEILKKQVKELREQI